MRRRRSGITLIELLIVAAIAAILAVIVSLFVRRAQLRSQVARTKSDMRTLAVAVESYGVEENILPTWGIGHPGPGAVQTFNWDVAQRTGNRSGVSSLPSFLVSDRSRSDGCFDTLTDAVSFISTKGSPSAATSAPPSLVVAVPVGRSLAASAQRMKPGDHFAYIKSYPVDPFCADRGATFVYWNVWPGHLSPGGKPMPLTLGWILISPGPDGDYDLPGSYEVYDPSITQPSPLLLGGANATGSAFTYDPTNGLFSDGDIYRVKQ